MIPLNKRIEAFECLGKVLTDIGENNSRAEIQEKEIVDSCLRLNKKVTESVRYNAWFDEQNVRRMMLSLGKSLERRNLLKWIERYEPYFEKKKAVKTIGVVMAGNIPVVGFHDMLSVLISGNKIQVKLSSDDNELLPAVAEVLFSIEPEFRRYVKFVDGPLKQFDAVIATGSNNTSRYFDYYFSAYPHIIRRNRNGVAVLTGNESEKELQGLADDIFQFYGLGCRNVSKIFVPGNYDFAPLLKTLEARTEVAENHKYFNNYEYNKAVFLVNSTQHFDTGNLLLTENIAVSSPVSVLYYEYYKTRDRLLEVLKTDEEKIQCVVGKPEEMGDVVPFGKSQQPALWDYADGVDTMEFLLQL